MGKSTLWRRTSAGIIAPRGVSLGSQVTYLKVKEKAVAVETLYAGRNVRLPPRCGLAVLIEAAKAACEAWLTGKERSLSAEQFYQAIHLDRVAGALLSGLIGDDKTTEEVLRRLTRGNLSLWNRTESPAKDALWELELNALLNRVSIAATLEEPPDIMLQVESQQVGVTCKKVYSDRHFSKTLSKGVSQLAGDRSTFGIVAVNLDDNLPPNTIRVATDPESPFQHTNLQFIEKHRHRFLKYLWQYRMTAILVSTAGIVYGTDGVPNMYRGTTVRALQTLPKEHIALLERIRMKLAAN
jgi:hypothetical protein